MPNTIEEFLFHCRYEKNLSEKTLKAYSIDLGQYSIFINNKHHAFSLPMCDKVVIKDFVKNLFEQNYKAKTVIRKIATLKAFYGYLEFEELILVSPFRKVRLKIKEPLRLPKTIKLTDIKTIIKKMYKIKHSFDFEDKKRYAYKALVRDLAIVELLFATGMRVSEACNIKKENIDLNGNSIKVIGKGNKERTLHLCSDEIRQILKEYLALFAKEIKASNYFFINRNGNRISEQSVRFMVKKYSQNANVKIHITPHMFRHSMATYLLEEGVDIRYIQSILGHSSISTTQIYTKVNLKHQKKLLTTKHPRKKFEVNGMVEEENV